jgi:hypothetical protein
MSICPRQQCGFNRLRSFGATSSGLADESMVSDEIVLSSLEPRDEN